MSAETVHWFKCRKCGNVTKQTQREDSGWIKDELTAVEIEELK